MYTVVTESPGGHSPPYGADQLDQVPPQLFALLVAVVVVAVAASAVRSAFQQAVALAEEAARVAVAGLGTMLLLAAFALLLVVWFARG